ncbi:hypothetical protein [Arthrobacter methylotrophus]|uniref:hypothetical protein n=1 Tax=Arthrobacter methylotrophus TaxID=121291 RepID=UPI0031E50C1D
MATAARSSETFRYCTPLLLGAITSAAPRMERTLAAMAVRRVNSGEIAAEELDGDIPRVRSASPTRASRSAA